jgi:hypothetical protein
MTFTDKPNIACRVGQKLLVFGIYLVVIYLLLWGGLEGYKFVGR